MSERLPGTNILVEKLTQEAVRQTLENIFGGGGLVLSQVTALGNMELYSVQNWVKRGFVSSPVQKRYTKRQFCRLVIINMLRECMTISDITALLSYINGVLSDESDDMVSDDVLYEGFVTLLSKTECTDAAIVQKAAEQVTKAYAPKISGASERFTQVLCIMYFAYRAALLKSESEIRLKSCIK